MDHTKKRYTGLEVAWWVTAMLFFGVSQLLQVTFLLYIGAALLLSFFFYRLYVEWRAGDRKAVQRRMLWLAVALVAGSLAYWYCS